MTELWRAIRLMRLSGSRMLWAVIASVMAVGSALSLAVISAWLITKAWTMPPVLDLTIAVTAVRALGISRGVFRYLERLASHDAVLDGLSRLHERIFLIFLQGNPRLMTTTDRGVIRQVAGEDADAIGQAVVRGVIPIVSAFVVSVSAVVMMALLSAPTAIVLAGCLIIAGVVAPWLSMYRAHTHHDEIIRLRNEINVISELIVDHRDELAVSGRLEGLLRRSEALTSLADEARRRADSRWAWASAAQPAAVGVSILAAVMCAIEASAHASPMLLGMVVLLPFSAFEAVSLIPDAASELAVSARQAHRMMQLLGEAGTHRAPTVKKTDHTPHITMNLSVGQCRAATVRADIEPGSRVLVTGASGSGKSTLLQTMAGLIPPVGGTINTTSGAMYFGDDAHIFDTSIAENVRLANGAASDVEVAAALNAVGFVLDPALHVDGDALSGGERRKLLLARAVVSPARTILLDEPTEHLDAEAASSILANILRTDEGLFPSDKTVVVVTHHATGSARLLADHVIDLASEAATDALIAL